MIKRILSLAIALALLCLGGAALADDGIPMPEFELQDQYGRTWTLADFEGKVVFLNYWTTWCHFCVEEMPDIEALYHEFGDNQGDVLILGIDSPEPTDSVDTAGIISFLAENGFTYPVLIDPDFSLGNRFGITAFPTTFIIKPDGTFLGKVEGMMSIDNMRLIISMGQQ